MKLEFGRFESDCGTRQTQFYSTAPPNFIFRDLRGYLTEKGAEFQQSDQMWRIQFTTQAGMRVACTLLKVDHERICVEFLRKNGDAFEFYELYKEIALHLNVHNDAVL